MRRWPLFILIIILLLVGLFLFLYISSQSADDGALKGKVYIDGKSYRVPMYRSEGEEELLIPVVATLCKLGYETTSEGNDIIELQSDEHLITINLAEMSLICPEKEDNCIIPGEEKYYFIERKGNDIFVDKWTFKKVLRNIKSVYRLTGFSESQIKYYLDDFEKLWAEEDEYIKNNSVEFDYEQWLLEYSSTRPEETPTEEPAEEKPDTVTNARLIVNGVDITGNHSVRLHHGLEMSCEIPLVATLCALGHKFKMQYNETENRYEVILRNEVWCYAYYEDGKIVDDLSGGVLKIENNDFIVDTGIPDVFTAIRWVCGGKITIDYETSTIYVESDY